MKTPKWLPAAAAVGGIAGVLYILTNRASLQRAAYRSASSSYASAQAAAGRAGVNLPGLDFSGLLPEPTYTADEGRVAMYGAQLAEALAGINWTNPVRQQTSVPNASGSPFGVQFGYEF